MNAERIPKTGFFLHLRKLFPKHSFLHLNVHLCYNLYNTKGEMEVSTW